MRPSPLTRKVIGIWWGGYDGTMVPQSGLRFLQKLDRHGPYRENERLERLEALMELRAHALRRDQQEDLGHSRAGSDQETIESNPFILNKSDVFFSQKFFPG